MNENISTSLPLKTLTRENLDKLVQETELTLGELKSELERRDQTSQEREVANLDQHMKSAEISLKTIRDFLAYLKDEFQQTRR